jgi:hypothetical protein
MLLLWRAEPRVSSLSISVIGKLLTRLGDINSIDYWYRTKQGRASMCKNSGIATCIVRSTRQQQEEPSTTVLANALSAIFGAIWLDLENQNEIVANTCSKVLQFLRAIGSGNANTLADSLTDGRIITVPERKDEHQSTLTTMTPNGVSSSETFGHDVSSMDVFMTQWFKRSNRIYSMTRTEAHFFYLMWHPGSTIYQQTKS